MKVYGLPDELEFKDPDYGNYDSKKEIARENAHRVELEAWMKENGYAGKNTGKTVCFPVADGRAEYMLADNGRKSCLIHLPYGDNYHYRDVEFLPKKEIMARIEQTRVLEEMFSAAASMAPLSP